MIKVTYYYSACVAITTPDVSILCDPWFTDGIYDGSWYQYPKIKDPIALIGKHDIIYVSHIHPDHYDPRFLKEYLSVYPDTEIVIAQGVFLDKKMQADDIPYTSIKWQGAVYRGSSRLNIIPNDTGSISDIDTALIVTYTDHAVVNMNDNQYYKPQIDKIKEFAPKIDIALIGHTGAGPYPQTYYKDDTILEQKAEEKKMKFFNRYSDMDAVLDARVNIPFAGQYILGGRLSHLNPYRGVSDAVEVLEFDDKAVVLEQGASIDTVTFIPTETRTESFDIIQMERYASMLTEPMAYMKDFKYLAPNAIPWGRLLSKAAKNAFDKCEYDGEGEYFITIRFADKEVCCELKRKAYSGIVSDPDKGGPISGESLIEIDYRYLFGLITGIYHWNNAEVGSQYMTTRVPDEYNRSVQRFLNFFTV